MAINGGSSSIWRNQLAWQRIAAKDVYGMAANSVAASASRGGISNVASAANHGALRNISAKSASAKMAAENHRQHGGIMAWRLAA